MQPENEIQLVEIVEMEEMYLVGFSVTSAFERHEPEVVEAMKRQFHSRKDEIRHAIHPERYLSPHFSSDVLFTYLICMEVSSLSDIPEGMLGFTVPPHRYAKVKTKGDPYRTIHDYLNRNGLQNDSGALSLEIYAFRNPVWPDEAEVYVPLNTDA
ncbi:GyrI-like domain-containing protein [Paenibacillus sp. N4]|uniref:GyrI-like domain-containing protein n=1 Tax=Paenibacillus vietnamensis TaxID=2590547 RepID=UPI001CD0B0E0|nr:GyrI-like domain-containing protein [Paenibacillus vietnamensis]MCA0757900.1 GyrI-like domain-containing protein [Paenibacillus vietnamensis]